MKWVYMVLPLAAAGAACIFLIQPAPKEGRSPAPRSYSQPTATKEPESTTSSLVATGIFASPFGRGTPVQQVESPEQVRRRHMESAGYNTPEPYHHLPPTQLIAMAKQGDLFAMLQLGERYVYENQLAKSPEASAYQGSSVEIGKRYFVDAVNAGHIPMAKALSRIYTEEHNYVAAYAWELVYARMSDKKPPPVNGNLGALDLQRSEAQAEELWQAASLRYVPKG